MKSDLDIARKVKLKPINEIAEKLGIHQDNLELFGKYKAKVSVALDSNKSSKAKLILVTAITPNKAGVGKTTMVIS